MATSLKGLCTPLQVFVVLAVISTIIYLINMFTSVHISDPVDPGHYLFKNNAVQYGYMALVLKIFFYIIFGYLLQVLCNNRLDKVAWIVLFLPYVLFGFIVAYAMSMGALAVVRGKTGLLSGSGFRVGGRLGKKEEAKVAAELLHEKDHLWRPRGARGAMGSKKGSGFNKEIGPNFFKSGVVPSRASSVLQKPKG